MSQLNARMEHPLTMSESKSGDSQYVPRGRGNIVVREIWCKNIARETVNKRRNIPEIVR